MTAMAIFTNSLEYALGGAEFGEEFTAELGTLDQLQGDPRSQSDRGFADGNWREFILYRAWCISKGLVPEMRCDMDVEPDPAPSAPLHCA